MVMTELVSPWSGYRRSVAGEPTVEVEVDEAVEGGKREYVVFPSKWGFWDCEDWFSGQRKWVHGMHTIEGKRESEWHYRYRVWAKFRVNA